MPRICASIWYSAPKRSSALVVIGDFLTACRSCSFRQKTQQQLESERALLTTAKYALNDAAVQHTCAISTLRSEIDLASQRGEAAASQRQTMANELAVARASQHGGKRLGWASPPFVRA
ncbi:hypothetical protein WJ88_08445 [Burkholderia ubonensis]|nr:hypothetical protein WJ88_08445 [Burkholderia ubonensis]